MNSRQKRSNGGYGLRRKIAKKRLDEDFEYYFSKIGTPYESKIIKSEDSAKMQCEEFETELQKPNVKGNVKNKDSPGKKRGRPRKVQISVEHHEPDISETNLKFVDLKEKRNRKTKLIFVDQNETTKAVDEIRDRNNVEDVAHEEEVEDDSLSKRLKLDMSLSEEMTGLREEEVSSLPEGEKENLPEEGVSLDSFSEERPAGGEIDAPEVEIFEGEESGKGGAVIHKTKRKYKRNRLSDEAIMRKLNLLNPHDKIECNECHKLLKQSSFRQHLRTHTGEKPFSCEVCNARFTRKGDVERHVRIVHNKQKPFKCSRCQRAFGDKKNLRWHLMNHDKKLFYICETCGFKFGKREYWENHVRFIHPLPGGIDPSAMDGELDDERLEALTDSLLEDEESMEESYENGSSEGFVNVGDYVQTSLVPEVECKVIKTEGFSTVSMKNFPNLVKVSRPKDSEIVNSPGVYVVNDSSPVNAVVIQINEPTGGGAVKSESVENVFPTNLLQVVTSKSETEGGNRGSGRPVIIDARGCSIQVNSSRDGENQLTGNEAPAKVYRLVMNNSDGVSRTNTNMHNLIEALLDAANGQKHAPEILPDS